MPCFIGAGPLCGCRGRGAGLKAASRRRRGVGVNSAGCAPLEVSCSLLCWSWQQIQTAPAQLSLPGVEFESMMTGTHQRWARARRAFGGPDASGVELDPNSSFMGCPHTVFAPKRRARAAAPVRTQAAVCFAPSHRAFVRPRRTWVDRAAQRHSGRSGFQGYRALASIHERHIAAAAGEQAAAPRLARAGAGQGAELERAAAGASRPPHDADDGRPGRRRAVVRRGGAARAAGALRGRAAPGLIGLHSAILVAAASRSPAL